MWLLNTTTHELRMFTGNEVPTYAILSHTWGADEVTFQDIRDLTHTRTKAGFSKIQGCCQKALRHGIEWAWIDSCCIDKSSSAELSEAINSMYSYYLLSRICLIYLADVPPLASPRHRGDIPSLAASRWFTRGWTLQELIAPRRAVFYASDWSRLGTKGIRSDEGPFLTAVARITGIYESILDKTRQPRNYSVAERMTWAAARQATRPEDLAYCLMGLFGVYMPVLYGEGLLHAFRRLQHEIIRTSPDETIFAWRADPAEEVVDPHTLQARRRAEGSSGLLATSPADFARSVNVHQIVLNSRFSMRLFGITNLGLSLSADLMPLLPVDTAYRDSFRHDPPRISNTLFVMPIGASDVPEPNVPHCRVGIYLAPVREVDSGRSEPSTVYRRVKCDQFCFIVERDGDIPQLEPKTIYVLEDNQFAEMEWRYSRASYISEYTL